jgi:hypothetical protein
MSKVFEKLLLKGLFPVVENKQVNTQPPFWVQTEAPNSRINASYSAEDK